VRAVRVPEPARRRHVLQVWDGDDRLVRDLGPQPGDEWPAAAAGKPDRELWLEAERARLGARSAVVGPGERWVVVAGRRPDGSRYLRRWDLADGRLAWEVAGGEWPHLVSADGGTVFEVRDHTEVVARDAATGAERFARRLGDGVPPGWLTTGYSPPSVSVVSADAGRVLVMVGYHGVLLCDPADGRVTGHVAVRGLRQVYRGPNGLLAFVSGDPEQVLEVRGENGVAVRASYPLGRSGTWTVVFAPDGRTVVVDRWSETVSYPVPRD
jgi:hypothetical protein